MGAREAVLLGILQALTEFLPVSSSGHLVLAEHLLHIDVGDTGLLFDVALHVGTLAAVVVALRAPIRDVVVSALTGVRDVLRGVPARTVYADSPGLRTGILVCVGTVPTALIGLGLESRIESTLRAPLPVGVLLLITAAVLGVTARVPRGHRTESDMQIGDALLIGFAQGLAVAPGISRAGATIAVGMIAGLRPETAARYSFLLSIPAILGAMVLQLGDVGDASRDMLAACGIGATVSMVVGWGALWALLRIVGAGRLHWFSPYLVLVGGAAILASLL